MIQNDLGFLLPVTGFPWLGRLFPKVQTFPNTTWY